MLNSFNPDRYSFIVMGNSILPMRRKDRDMTTHDWATKVLGISESDYRCCVRGYFTPDRIQFCTADYKTDTTVDDELVDAARSKYASIYMCDFDAALDVPVFNGLLRGDAGDMWPPYLMWSDDIFGWEIVVDDDLDNDD